MKKYLILTALLIAAIVTLLAGKPASQKFPNIVPAFASSIDAEKRGDYAEAIRLLAVIYPEHRGDYLMNLRLGWLHYLSRKHEESGKYYTMAIDISSRKSIEAFLGLTLPMAALERWDAVESAYRSILALDGNNYTANLRLGQIYLNRGQYAKAKPLLDKAQTLYPGEYEANLSLGWTHYYMGDRPNARRLLTTALMLAPGDSLALKGLDLAR